MTDRAENPEAGKFTLPALLLLSLALRIAAAVATGVHHPDAIYQYLEPAHRLLTGEGVVTWEWRVGMRGWLLPWLFTAPIAAERLIAPGSGFDIVAPRLAIALASLGMVWAAWRVGARVSRTAALVAGFVAATWLELVYFGAQTLSETVATAALLPAAALLGGERPRTRALAGAGLLLGLAVLARPHYAPVAAILLVGAVGRISRVRPFTPVLYGGLAALALGAIADMAAGAPPLAWVVENVRQNLLLRKATEFGVFPWYSYLLWWWELWRWAAVPIALGAWWGRKASPPLFWAAIANVALHSLLAHKEYRFILFSTAALVILAAIGWAEVARRARWPRWAMLGVAAAVSVALALTGTGRAMLAEGREGPTLFAPIARDPHACGVALVGVEWWRFPGHVGLGRGRSLLLLTKLDAASRGVPASHLAPSANYLIAPAAGAAPPGYARAACATGVDGTAMCLWHRPGPCDGRASRFEINAVLGRIAR